MGARFRRFIGCYAWYTMCRVPSPMKVLNHSWSAIAIPWLSCAWTTLAVGFLAGVLGGCDESSTPSAPSAQGSAGTAGVKADAAQCSTAELTSLEQQLATALDAAAEDTAVT